MKLTTTHFAGALLIAAGMVCTNPCMAQTDSTATILEIAVSPTVDSTPGAQSPTPQAVKPAPAICPGQAPSRTQSSRQVTWVNGQAAYGSFIETLSALCSVEPRTSCCKTPETPSLETWVFELKQADGTAIGTIVASGIPASPQFAIVSGTGAYFGVQGFVTLKNARQFASPTIDSNSRYPSPAPIPSPAYQLTLYPLALPSVAEGAAGPAVVHGADSTQVSASQPAHSSEAVTVYALNLLPQPQSAVGTSPALPVSVTIGGMDAPVLWAGRYQNSPDGYQINVQLPQGLNSGLADLQIVSGFIAGPAVQIYVEGGSGLFAGAPSQVSNATAGLSAEPGKSSGVTSQQAAVGAGSITLVSTIGTSVGYHGLNSALSAEASWSQTATFSNVSISAVIDPGSGEGEHTFAWTAYLTTKVGAGTTTDDVIAQTTFSVTGTESNPTFVTLFASLTLRPGTYHLVLAAAPGQSGGWEIASPGTTPSTASGIAIVSANGGGAPAGFPPATDFAPESPANLLEYSVTTGPPGAERR